MFTVLHFNSKGNSESVYRFMDIFSSPFHRRPTVVWQHPPNAVLQWFIQHASKAYRHEDVLERPGLPGGGQRRGRGEVDDII